MENKIQELHKNIIRKENIVPLAAATTSNNHN